MPSPIRTLSLRGPKFYEDAGRLTFLNTFDAVTRDGPRQATKEDTLAHPDAWTAFVAEAEAAETLEASRKARLAAQLAGKDEAAAAEAAALAALEAFDPFRALVTFSDPEGGPPEPDARPHAARRDGRARGEA